MLSKYQRQRMIISSSSIIIFSIIIIFIVTMESILALEIKIKTIDIKRNNTYNRGYHEFRRSFPEHILRVYILDLSIYIGQRSSHLKRKVSAYGEEAFKSCLYYSISSMKQIFYGYFFHFTFSFYCYLCH